MSVTEEKNKKIIIIDSNSVIHRAYHALPPLRRKNGELVNAVYGFLLVFFKAIKDFHPDFIAATFDFPAPTFRHKKYKAYKAKRPRAPEDLYAQIPRVKEFLKSFGVSIFEKEGFEADDIIGTIAKTSQRQQVLPPIDIIILSGDMDALQLVDDRTKVYVLRKGVKDIVLYDEKQVEKKFQGLIPEQILDFKSLRGDPSDNIPGVTGVGEKTAISLLLTFNSLDELYREVENKTKKAERVRPKLRDTLLKYKEQALISRELAKVETNVPIDFSLKSCGWVNYDKKEVARLLESFEFYSLIKKLPDPSKKEERGLTRENLRLW